MWKCIRALVTLVVIISMVKSQAPGDEDNRCNSSSFVHTYPDNVKVLMDSYNYEQLLPGNGTGNNVPISTAVWNDRSVDRNDVTSISTATYVRVYTICMVQKMNVI